ncbi:type II toxin-antitoxin system toxin TsaT [Staphylococcus cohnii]|uniref:type II toxin-antitoxin system toxin TsaT n=1 Tax=Staphylococcus cohnii TaxID=29382 RepID=UPI003CEA27F4
MSLHFMIVFWLSLIFLICGIISLIFYKLKETQQTKESLLGLTVMLIIFGVVGILFTIIFS